MTRLTWPSFFAFALISSSDEPSPSICVLALLLLLPPPPHPAATTLSAPTSRPNAAQRTTRTLRPIIRILPPIRRSSTPVPGASRLAHGALLPRGPRSTPPRGSAQAPGARHRGRA